MAASEWLTIDEVSELYHISKATLYTWRYEKKGPPGCRLGKRVVYRRQDVDKWAEARLRAENRGFV